MNKKIIFAVAVLLILFLPMCLQSVNADTYSCKKIHVSTSYRKVGRTPQSITVYSKMKVDDDMLVSYWEFRNVFIELETYYDHYRYGKGWYDEDSKAFYNTYGLGGRISNSDFTVNIGTYRKCWYCSTTYYKFTVIIGRDKDLYFHHTFPHRLKVTLNGLVAYSTVGNIYSIRQESFSIIGSSGKFSVRSTGYSDYSKYWGNMMTTTDYTTLQREQEQMGDIGSYDETFMEAHGGRTLAIMVLAVLLVVAVGFTYASHKRRYQ